MASDLELPAGVQFLSERQSPLARYALPMGSASKDEVPVQNFEGQVLRRTWRLTGQTSAMQLYVPMREQVQDAGFEVQFECQARSCGGFDFRFGIEVVPAPDMLVDIGDFQFLSATKGDNQALSLLVSRSGLSTYMQLIEVTPSTADPIGIAPVEPRPDTRPPKQTEQVEESGLAEALNAHGRVVLDGLVFETGSSRLGSGPFEVLAQLAALLIETPEMRISLVGHTDNVGNQENNITLSQRRAEAVRERLVKQFEIDGAQIDAVGVGYMAPLTSNLTAGGRDANRRVEAVLLSR
ncbi:cell envelope biogenesis protein OmpA [Sedimentitalea sp. CY04]|uniref:Cell envelope biogenesis protein OmpA n=2 Tax=Parasedimentitalea denitrificans TaxID=2211118 RepID=A0ABX0W645_9RHOB|nr:OmpA family protein [Sedimentitalea sp. CY04]NIZ61042.1 cell envelope biogenesis protein OmpA [Sedimentitalea sp. CY04]